MVASRTGYSGARHKNAYVTMMYCGTPRDWAYYIATRVLLNSLASARVQADLVVLISENCPASWLRQYEAEGFRLVHVSDIPNPYRNQEKYEPRFESSLNKLYGWTLTEYSRVVMLDADNMFLRPIDELFLCGQFCAAYIDPCIFHTGLFVLQPSNETFNKMVTLVGQLDSLDGGDQGFLISYFSDLLSQPLFQAPANGSALSGTYRLTFGYQMDTSYYYWRMMWRPTCGANSVLTFPGVPVLKPWFWYTWPLLPFGFEWHERRRSFIGYEREAPVFYSVSLISLVALAISSIWRLLPNQTRPVLAARIAESVPYPLNHRLVFKVGVMAYMVGTVVVPFAIVPPVIHPAMGWIMFFLTSLMMLQLLSTFLLLPWTVYTTWVALLVTWIDMFLPLYSHGMPRVMSIALLAFVSAPCIISSFRDVWSHIDVVLENYAASTIGRGVTPTRSKKMNYIA